MLEILYTFYSFKPHENEKCLAKRLNGDNLVGLEPTTYCSSTELWPLGHTTPHPLLYVMHSTSPGFRLWDWNMRKGQWVCVKSKLNTHYCKWGQFENCGPLLKHPLIVYSPLIAFLAFYTPQKSWDWENWFTWTLQALHNLPTIYIGNHSFYHIL